MHFGEPVDGRWYTSLGPPPGVSRNLPFQAHFERLDLADLRDHIVGRHQHRGYECLAIRDGDYRCAINDVDLPPLAAGMVVVKPGDWHQERSRDRVAFAAFRLALLPSSDGDRSASIYCEHPPATAQVLTDAARFWPILERIQAAAHDPGPFAAFLLDALAGEFLWELVAAIPEVYVAPQLLASVRHHAFGRSLYEVFDRHLDRALTLDALAAALGMPARSLSAQARAAFGDSPMRLFLRRRMQHARLLLMQTDLSIQAISQRLGFANPYHFSAAYRRMHGCPPSQHR